MAFLLVVCVWCCGIFVWRGVCGVVVCLCVVRVVLRHLLLCFVFVVCVRCVRVRARGVRDRPWCACARGVIVLVVYLYS